MVSHIQHIEMKLMVSKAGISLPGTRSLMFFFPLEIGSNGSSCAVETFPLGRCGLFHEGMAASEKRERLGVEHNSAM